MAKRILVCGDSAFMRDTLTQGGYAVVGEVCDGQQAAEQFALLKPDLVLLDLSVPAMDGIQALKLMRQQDSNACVIVCAAMGQQGLVMEAMKNGAKDFLVKPFLGSRLLDAVNRCLK